MSVNTIPGTQSVSTQTQTTKTTKGTSGLTDYDQFLKLLVTQLKYQDPLNPSSQEDFLAQTAQFSSVEQLISLNDKLVQLASSNQASAASLIGRKVSGTTTDEDGVSTDVAGLVAQIDYGPKGELTLGLQGGATLPFANITSITEA